MKKLIPSLFIILISCGHKSPAEKDISKENLHYNKAFDYRDKGEIDSAYYHYLLSKVDFQKVKDSLGMAKCFVNMAIIQTDKGDFFGGIETSLDADKVLKKSDSITNEIKSSNYNNLAIANAALKNFERAEKYYILALNSTQNHEAKFMYYNNIADNYLNLKNYQKAKENFRKALQTKDNISYATSLNNLAKCLYKENQNAKVLPYFLTSLKIRTQEKDLWGLNSSYATLADYHLEKEPHLALSYANKMLDVATLLNSPDDRLEALQKLILLEAPENSKKHFLQYQKLNDSVQTERAKAKNQFALIRYESDKKELENQKLRAETAKKENRLLRQNILVVFLLLGIIISFFWYQRRKKFLAQQEEIKIKKTELKYSKKVHDVVANGIYRVMSEVENTEALNKENLLDKLENIYEKSRDISYENALSPEKNFYEYLNGLISSYSNEDLKILIINDDEIWKNTSAKIQNEIKLIVQELLVNLKKHSRASFAKVSFEAEDGKILISYFDNGIGMPQKNFVKKNGLQNTESRIFSLNGNIIFVTDLDQGTKINIQIPV